MLIYLSKPLNKSYKADSQSVIFSYVTHKEPSEVEFFEFLNKFSQINFTMKFQLIEFISRQRALDLELSLSKMLGICHTTILSPAKSFLFYVYCIVVTIAIYLIYPMLELIDVLLYCDSIIDYTQNLCLTLCHIANVGKVFNLVLRRDKLKEMINYVLTIEKSYVKSERQVILDHDFLRLQQYNWGCKVSLTPTNFYRKKSLKATSQS